MKQTAYGRTWSCSSLHTRSTALCGGHASAFSLIWYSLTVETAWSKKKAVLICSIYSASGSKAAI